MSYQINEKLKFHKSEIDSLNSSDHVRGIPVELYWILEPQPDKYEIFLRKVQHFVSLSVVGHFVGAVGCIIDEESSSPSEKWALVLPKGIGSLRSLNLSEIDLLLKVRMALQLVQGLHLLSTSEEVNCIHVIPSLDNVILFKNDVVKLDLEKENLLSINTLTQQDITNRFYGLGIVFYYLFRYNKQDQYQYKFNDILQGKIPDLAESDVPVLFQSIINTCWSGSIQSFNELESTLKENALLYFVGEENSKPRRIWGNSLDDISFDEWHDNLSEYVPASEPQINVAKSILRYNRSNANSDIDKSNFITIENFSNFLTWFGPSCHYSIFDDMEQLVGQSWFTGCFSSDEAISVLSNQPGINQCFLLRLNLGKNSEVKKCPYTLSISMDDYWSDDRLKLIFLSRLLVREYCEDCPFSLLPFHMLFKISEFISIMEKSSHVYQHVHIYHLRISNAQDRISIPFFGIEETETVTKQDVVQPLIKLIEKITNTLGNGSPNFDPIKIGKPSFTDEEVMLFQQSRLAFSQEF